jgi:hypothetical protein
MMGCKASTFAKHLSAKLAKKWRKPYSQVCRYINVRLSIAMVRAATHHFTKIVTKLLGTEAKQQNKQRTIRVRPTRLNGIRTTDGNLSPAA